ncbi:MAG: gliding motility-associated C-terminal domain-containing protein [Crocinitomicaceae bacterium]|nr:gliding motility-associated C-terminal domain-containing protein [Crocinitomicaceae bacterium]
MRYLYLFIVIFFIGKSLYSQVNCTNNTPFFTIDLTGNPSGTWVSPAVVRNGSCCGGGTNQVNCIELSITLDPAAEGIIFNVASGANPGGSLYYQINCVNIPVPSGSAPICLDGVGPHLISYCKVGNNTNTYSITSVPAPLTSGDIITADGCSDTLSVTGLQTSTITWNSISPGSSGQYNNYLNNLSGSQPGTSGVTYTGHSSVVVTPQPNYPNEIQYKVCGTVVGGCGSSTFCDTTTVSIYPTLFAIPGPNVAICNGTTTGTPVTVAAQGGVAPFTYTWVGPGGFNQINVHNNATDQVTAMIAGTYQVTVMDATGCPGATTSINVVEYFTDIIANPGNDFSICGTPAPTLNLSGSVSATNSGIWSGGEGSFSPDAASLSLSYTPTADEIAAGSVTLTLTPTNTLGCPFIPNDITISLTQFTDAITINPVDISCFGLANGSIDLTIDGGTPGYSYTWSNGAVTEDINSLPAGTYSVNITDANGCTNTQTITLTEPPVLNASTTAVTYAGGWNVSCNGASDGAIDLTVGGGTPGYSYAWNNGATTEDLSGLTAGTYYVTITDANGCTNTQTITLTEPPVLTASTTAVTYAGGWNVSCNGANDGAIDLTVGGGTPGYSYAWNNGATTEDITSLPAGTYSVNITDANGCTNTQTITLTEPPVLTASTTAVTYAGGWNVSCNGASDGAIDLTVSGGTPGYSYVWNNGATTEDLSGLTAGTYSVTVTDANGCTNTQTITLTEPPVLTASTTAVTYAGGWNVSCNGASDGAIDLTVGGATPGYSYTWSNGAVTEDINSLPAGTYSVNITDANGCTNTQTITLTEPPVLTASTTADTYAGGWNVSCNGANDGAIDLTVSGGTPGYSYIWSNGAVTEDITSLPAGAYSVHIIDANGCTNTQTITLTEPPVLTASTTAVTYAGGWNVSCNGANDGAIDLTVGGGTPGYSYVWNNGATTEDLSGLTAGTYSVTITDANGCQHSNQIFINQPEELTSESEITSDYNGSDISCFGASDGSASLSVNGGTPGYTYIWMNSDNEVIGNSPTISGIPSGVYNVLTIDANGCQSSASVTLSDPEFLFTDINTLTDYYGLPVSCENKEDGVIEVVFEGGTPTYTIAWENPASNSAILSNIGPGEYTVTIYDANGCQISDNIVLEGHPIPEFSPAPPVEVCIGDELILDCITEPGNNVIWTFSNGYTDNSCSPSPFTVDFVGCIDASVEVTSPFGCTNTWLLSDYICSNPLPDADFTTTPSDVTFISSTAYFENLSTGAVSYEWNFGDNSPNSFQENVQHTFPDAGPGQYTITLIATSEFGCIDSISKPIRVKDALIFYVPNTFTPDGDNFNNTFLPVFYSGFDPYDYTLLIFNRWGECIFESHNVEIGWDGTYNGKMAQDGTYTWNIEVRNVEDSKRFQQTGHVNLIR